MTKNFLRENVFLILLLLFSLFLRVFALENIPGVLGDEAWGFAQIHSYLKGLPYTFDVPSGRMLNPIYAAIIFIFHSADPFYMRLVSVTIGFLSVGASYFLFKRIYGKQIAATITLIFSCFPLHIYYSRLAWDCCLIPLLSVILSYLILKRKTFLFLIFMVIGFSVHPTMIYFLIPASFVFVSRLRDEEKKLPWKCMLTTGTAVLGFIFYYMQKKDLGFRTPYPSLLARFAAGIPDFTAGTIMADVDWSQKILFMLISGFSLLALVWLGRRKLSRNEKAYFLGMLFTFPALFLIMGAWPVLPGYERLILFAGFPLCYFIGLVSGRIKHGKMISLLFAGFYLINTIGFVFNPVLSGTNPSQQLRSGPIEPKYAAINWIVDHHDKARVLNIIAEDWGIYWNTYNFLLVNYPGSFHVHRVSPIKFQFVMDEGAFAVGYRNGTVSVLVNQSSLRDRHYLMVGFKDYSGEDFVYVWKMKE